MLVRRSAADPRGSIPGHWVSAWRLAARFGHILVAQALQQVGEPTGGPAELASVPGQARPPWPGPESMMVTRTVLGRMP